MAFFDAFTGREWHYAEVATGKRSALPSVLKVDTEGGHNLRGLVHLAMSDTSAKPERSWQDIVAEAARALRENNRGRLADLRRELKLVLKHRNKGVRAEATSDNNLPAQRKTA